MRIGLPLPSSSTLEGARQRFFFFWRPSFLKRIFRYPDTRKTRVLITTRPLTRRAYVIHENLSTFSHRPIGPFALGNTWAVRLSRQPTSKFILSVEHRLIDVADLYEIDRRCVEIFLRLVLASGELIMVYLQTDRIRRVNYYFSVFFYLIILRYAKYCTFIKLFYIQGFCKLI